MKELVIFDVDNTIVNGQSQRLLLSYLRKKKEVSHFYYIVVLFWFMLYKIGFLKDPRKIISFAYSFLRDKTLGEVSNLMDHFMTDSLEKNIFPDAVVRIQQFRNDGLEVVLVSNAPDIIIRPLGLYLGIKSYVSTNLEIIDERYSGKVTGDIMYGDNKLKAMREYAQTNGYDLRSAWAYGDHDSDIPILEAVGHPVVINPSKNLLIVAKQKKWDIYSWKM